MRSSLILLVVCLLASAAVSQAPAVTSGDVPLEFKTTRKPIYELPASVWSQVGQAIELQARLGSPVSAQVKGTQLQVDGDGDGIFELRVEGTKSRIITLGGKSKGAGRYAVEIQDRGGWKFRSACSLVAKVSDVSIRLFDQNNNGRFDDFGEDAVIVGRGRVASFLSRTLNINGELYEIEIDSANERLSFEPFDGDAGTLSVSVATQAKVLGAVVCSADGKYSFELSRAASPVKLPVGNYSLYSATIGLGKNRVKVRKGAYPDIQIQSGASSEITWGGPVRADFTYLRANSEIRLSPETIRYFGKSGEEYYAWYPDGKSPRIVIDDGKTGRQIAEAYFPGTC